MRRWQLIIFWGCMLAYCLLCWASLAWLLLR